MYLTSCWSEAYIYHNQIRMVLYGSWSVSWKIPEMCSDLTSEVFVHDFGKLSGILWATMFLITQTLFSLWSLTSNLPHGQAVVKSMLSEMAIP